MVELERILRELSAAGRLVKDRPGRQIWRMEINGRGYFIKFYPRTRSGLKRLVRGSPALREFFRLQWLQKGKIAAPRPVGVLSGFELCGKRGDAVITEALEPAVGLDEHLNQAKSAGRAAADHRPLASQVIEIVRQLGIARLRHRDLHLGNFLLSDGKLFLLDAYAVEHGPMKQEDVLKLGHSVREFATRTDVLRAWRRWNPDSNPPKNNPVSLREWNKALGRIWGENRYFGRFNSGEWTVNFVRRFKYAKPWSSMSGRECTAEQWQQGWIGLLDQIAGGKLTALAELSQTLSGQVTLGGQVVDVLVRRMPWGGRAWRKAWELVYRDIPTLWPMAVVRRKVLGLTAEALLIVERPAGEWLARMDLDALSAEDRQRLFGRLGRTLRRLDQSGLYTRSANANHWWVATGLMGGPVPMLAEVAMLRRNTGWGWSMSSLLGSMKDHPQYMPEDSLALCRGYAPFARMRREEES
jgi:hypothetical protein